MLADSSTPSDPKPCRSGGQPMTSSAQPVLYARSAGPALSGSLHAGYSSRTAGSIPGRSAGAQSQTVRFVPGADVMGASRFCPICAQVGHSTAVTGLPEADDRQHGCYALISVKPPESTIDPRLDVVRLRPPSRQA